MVGFLLLLFLALLFALLLLAALQNRKAAWLAIACAGAVLLLGVIPVVDIAFHGPYVRWYNHRLNKEAVRGQLIGADEALVEPTLGRPSFVKRDLRDDVATYNYAPYPFFPFAKFEVHCVKGKVRSLEMFDD